MTNKWDDGEGLEAFLKSNKGSLNNLDTTKIYNREGKVTICEMVRRVIDSLILNDIDKTNPEAFEDILNRLKYVYACGKKMQNRIVQLGGKSDDLFEKVDPDYDINKRVERIRKLKS